MKKAIKALGVIGIAFLAMLGGLILHIAGQKTGIGIMTVGMVIVLVGGIVSMCRGEIKQ